MEAFGRIPLNAHLDCRRAVNSNCTKSFNGAQYTNLVAINQCPCFDISLLFWAPPQYKMSSYLYRNSHYKLIQSNGRFIFIVEILFLERPFIYCYKLYKVISATGWVCDFRSSIIRNWNTLMFRSLFVFISSAIVVHFIACSNNITQSMRWLHRILSCRCTN